MSADTQDYVGEAGNAATQGLGRLAAQYSKSPALQALLGGILAMANDLELLFQRVARMLDPNDDVTYDPGAAGVYPVNTQGAKGVQLELIGRIVGVTNTVPAAGTATASQTLTDAQYLKLITLKIFRNHVLGCTVPQLLKAIQIIMPDLTTSVLLTIEEIGHMTTIVAIGREVENWEAGIFAIPSGQNPLRGAVLPRPMGVTLATFWRDAGCFTWATEADLTVLVNPDGVGFNTSESITTGIGRWAEDF